MQVDTDRATLIPGPGPVTGKDILRWQIDAYIDRHLGEENLGSTSLARRFRLSRATLYRLFEDRDGIARHIRERRLQAASSQLARPSPPRLTWLLHELGFASERQFQRAFRARFGMCPTQWRKHPRMPGPCTAVQGAKPGHATHVHPRHDATASTL